MRREIIQFATATVLCTSGLTWSASDLVVTDIELIPALPAVTTGLLRATITNIGPDETGLPALSQIGVEFYHDGVICDDATIAGDLNASESVTSETTACNPDIAGTYDITVIVDSDFDVSESNEANNDRIEPFEWVETGPVVIFDTDFALPAMPDGDGAGTPVCIDPTSGLLVAGCDVALTLRSSADYEAVINSVSPNNWGDTVFTNMLPTANSICFLSGQSLSHNHARPEIDVDVALCRVYDEGGLWKLKAMTGKPWETTHITLHCYARCLEWNW